MFFIKLSLLLIIFCASSYIWTFLHELAHLISAKLLVGVNKWEIDVPLIPTKSDDVLTHGKCALTFKRKPKVYEKFLVYLSPKILELLAFVFWLYFLINVNIVGAMLFAHPVITYISDIFNNCKGCDVVETSNFSGINHWILRLLFANLFIFLLLLGVRFL